MSRLKLLKGLQGDLLSRIRDKYHLEWRDISRACRVHHRTLYDWRRGKYLMRYGALQYLQKKYDIPMPKIELLPENWNVKNAASLGGISRNALYGNPGTAEGRRKGGLAVLKKYKLNPELFQDSGFIGPKDIKYPVKSALLSELTGIILGDGSIAKYQVTVSLNSKVEKEYAHFVLKLFKKLFNLKAALRFREQNTCNVVVSSVKLVAYLQEIGLVRGDKIRQQVCIPKWILKNKKYMIGCLRGLFDTDGGVYYHNHTTKGIRYRHLGLCFTSYSAPLLRDVHSIFLTLGFPAKINPAGHVFVYDRKAIKRYFAEIETHNIHHFHRYRNYFRSGGVA